MSAVVVPGADVLGAAVDRRCREFGRLPWLPRPTGACGRTASNYEVVRDFSAFCRDCVNLVLGLPRLGYPALVRRSGNYASSQFFSIAWRQTMQPSCLPLANLLPRIMRWRSWVTLPSMFDGQFVGRPCWQGWLQCRSGNDAVLLDCHYTSSASCNRDSRAICQHVANVGPFVVLGGVHAELHAKAHCTSSAQHVQTVSFH